MKDCEPGLLARYRSSILIVACMTLWTIFVTNVIDVSVVVTLELMVVVPLIVLLISILARRT